MDAAVRPYISLEKGRSVAARASDVLSNFKIQLCELSLLQSFLFSFFLLWLFLPRTASANLALPAALT